MILYDPNMMVSLVEFGIQIPICDSRTTRTFEALRRHPRIGPQLNRLHHKHIDEQLERKDLLRAHAPEYVAQLYADRLAQAIMSTYELMDAKGRLNRYDPDQARLPLTDLFGRILTKAAGTVQCARLALAHGFCFYFAGGMHHAHYDHGSGFCLINDIVIAARKLQAEKKIETVWVIDVDAHKGDGTAAITSNDPSITTLCVHMARGWPLDGAAILADGRPNPAFAPSTIDIPVESGAEASYLDKLKHGLDQLAQGERPDLAIVECGADPYEKDELPSAAGLKLSLDQLLARDQLIYSFLKKQSIPAAYLMAGGYGNAVWQVFARFLIWALDRPGSDNP
jgi:acetoin utilization deacetylase AcuC-like enzyme